MKYSILIIFVAIIHSTTINIPADYSTIQEGINNTATGDTVLVAPGIYYENIQFNLSGIVVASQYINSFDPQDIQETVIDGNQNGSVIVFSGALDSTAVLMGFSLINGTGTGGDGSHRGGGIACWSCSPKVDHVIIRDNHVDRDGGGIVMNTSNMILSNVTITGNSAPFGAGIFLFDESNPKLINSIVWGNDGNQIYLYSGATIRVLFSDIQYGVNGIVLHDNHGFTPQWLQGNFDSNPLFWNSELDDFRLLLSSPCIDTGNPEFPFDPDQTIVDVGALFLDQNVTYGCIDNLALNWDPDALVDDGSCIFYEGPVWHVSTDGSDEDGNGTVTNPFLTLQKGLTEAALNDTVLVHPGEYIEEIILGRSITLMSASGADSTFISPPDSVEIAINAADFLIFNTLNISGFTIHNADWGIHMTSYNAALNVSNCKIVGNDIGMKTRSHIRWNLDHCIFDENGIGIYHDYYGFNSSITNCTFANSNMNVYFRPFYATPTLEVVNSVFFGDIYGESCQINVQYSNLFNFTEETETIDFLDGVFHLNPLLVDPPSGDYSLQISSPCIDTGNPDLDDDGITWIDDSDDQDPDGTRMDIGAFYYHQIIGCTDSEAINFNPEAISDDGNCIYLEDIEPHFSTVWSGVPNNPMGFYISTATLNSIDLRVGDEIAIFDGEICVGLAQLESEIDEQISIFTSADDPDSPEVDGFINGNEVYYRYWDASEQIEIINILVEVTDGANEFQSLGFVNVFLSVDLLLGCTNPEAVNFNSDANVDDGSCIIFNYGCMDETACNYDPEADTDDGSCLVYDCNNECGGNATIDGCGVCDYDPTNNNECIGCMDQWAINFSPIFTIDDNSCIYPSLGDISMDGILNVIDIVELVEVVLDGESFIFYMDFNFDSQINIIDVVILVDIILNPSHLGCTDANASNFNPDSIYDDGSCEYTYQDIDGNIYETVQIGDQLWMAENLKVTHYQNGDQIPTGFTNSEWSNLDDTETGAFAVYNDDPATAETYGNLYNWYAVADDREICSEGFHVPSDAEWMILEMFLGMSYGEAHDSGNRGTDQGSQLADNADLWVDGALENNSEFGSSGFVALPGGYRSSSNGGYYEMDTNGDFWSSTANDSSNAWFRALNHNTSEVYRTHYYTKRSGYSLRCLMD
jgi:uncharacterized protein (TIGR02145 family)